jgi:hypothetical protein
VFSVAASWRRNAWALGCEATSQEYASSTCSLEPIASSRNRIASNTMPVNTSALACPSVRFTVKTNGGERRK